MAISESYFETRFKPDPVRESVWRHLTKYLARYVPADASLLELGAGYCSFANNITARRRVAVDRGPQVLTCAAAGVEPVQADVLTYLPTLAPGSFDFIFASNFLEHFEWRDLDRIIAEIHRLLTINGRLCLIQPNFRLAPGRYFDDYTHRTVFSDESLNDWLEASGFRIVRSQPRFMPLTLKSRLGGLSFLVPLYLRLPWRPFAGQMLVLAERKPTDPASVSR
jgi:SAM-dependent methyltransferase